MNFRDSRLLPGKAQCHRLLMQFCVVSGEAREADRFWISRLRLFAGAQIFPTDDSEQSLCLARSIREAFWKTGGCRVGDRTQGPHRFGAVDSV
ncbi:hypothetical protein [Hydrogenophaga sp. PAMC20947]|uniref:hypothetical protein n=1 Tax=Hydrogenophaga sp. PAMC20947 TaxID=2565558 RepID=UPI00109DE386|nr:hypothetical protein [Hydrogenophaga sp. PAMC20947]QCB45866.1 hypothetical protein E5678_07445 [Hydrogenophaga sp. PAMC20947]